MEKYAYIRVSTREQNEARQLIAMLAQVRRENIFIDKKSGGDFERAAYQALKERLRPGDLVYIKSIDRLGRNYREIIAEWRGLTQERGVRFGRPSRPLPENFAEIYERWRRGLGIANSGQVTRKCTFLLPVRFAIL